MSNLDLYMVKAVRSTWFKVLFLMAALLALALAAGAPYCIGC